jgi:hypothetical protein
MRVAKIASAICTISVVVLSFFAFIVAGSMGKNALDRSAWIVATVVLPLLATSAFIWSAAREPQERSVSASGYFVAIIIFPMWFVLTRS